MLDDFPARTIFARGLLFDSNFVLYFTAWLQCIVVPSQEPDPPHTSWTVDSSPPTLTVSVQLKKESLEELKRVLKLNISGPRIAQAFRHLCRTDQVIAKWLSNASNSIELCLRHFLARYTKWLLYASHSVELCLRHSFKSSVLSSTST